MIEVCWLFLHPTLYSSDRNSLYFNASPNRHKKPTFSGEILGISNRFLWPIDFTLLRVIYQMDLWFYESIDTSLVLCQGKKKKAEKGMRFCSSHVCVNNAFRPHKSLCLMPIPWRRETATTMKLIFLASQITARNYYVNVEELVKESVAIVNWQCKSP